MTLKEAFRYQNFLTRISCSLRSAITSTDNMLRVTKTHRMKTANPEAQDKSEEVKVNDRIDMDQALKIYGQLLEERQKLTEAIAKAKAGLGFCMDAAIETNKARQDMAATIRNILRVRASETTEPGTGYKFNAEGNQTPYTYEITVATNERFDREEFKKAMDKALREADEVSGKIDAAMVTTQVDYNPPWDVNATLEDILG